MNLKGIKYFFIVAFILLNGLLLFLWLGRLNGGEDPAAELSGQTDIEANIENGNITVNFSPMMDSPLLPMLSATRVSFDEDSVPADAVNDVTLSSGNHRLYAELKVPVALDREENTETPYLLTPANQRRVDSFLAQDIVAHADDYRFAFYDSERRLIVYGQAVDDERLFRDHTAELVLHLNEQNAIVSFEQTYVENVKPEGEPDAVISMQKALENAYRAGRIPAGATVFSAELGYQNTLTVDDIVVYRPTWLLLSELAGEPTLTRTYLDGIKGHIVQKEKHAADEENGENDTDENGDADDTTDDENAGDDASADDGAADESEETDNQ